MPWDCAPVASPARRSRGWGRLPDPCLNPRVILPAFLLYVPLRRFIHIYIYVYMCILVTSTNGGR